MSEPDDTRERILEVAGKVFAEKGFRAATVRGICEQAGANLAAVNYYFGDKHRLYLEAVRRAHQRRVQQVPMPQWPAGTAPEEKLRGFIRTMMTRMVHQAGQDWHGQLMMRELFQPTDACVELVRDFIRPHFELLLGILDELLPPQVPEVERHLAAFSIVGQCLHYRVARPVIALLVAPEEFGSYEPVRLAEYIGEFSLAALAGRAAGVGRSEDTAGGEAGMSMASDDGTRSGAAKGEGKQP